MRSTNIADFQDFPRWRTARWIKLDNKLAPVILDRRNKGRQTAHRADRSIRMSLKWPKNVPMGTSRPAGRNSSVDAVTSAAVRYRHAWHGFFKKRLYACRRLFQDRLRTCSSMRLSNQTIMWQQCNALNDANSGQALQ
ncbi:hypothetical protein AMELA_G00237000, partial [Ameiurus melas]